MKRLLGFAAGLAAVAMVATPVAAGGFSIKVQPWTYDPGHTGIIVSAWHTHIGLSDAGNSDHGLVLQKNGPTATNAAAGASVGGVKGITISNIGYDVKDGSHCSGGAPRFNVDASDGFHFAGACTSATPTGSLTDSRGATWTRYRISPDQMFPPLSPTATINSIDIVFDEGTDTAGGTPGQAIIDNIDVNGTLAGKPGNS